MGNGWVDKPFEREIRLHIYAYPFLRKTTVVNNLLDFHSLVSDRLAHPHKKDEIFINGNRETSINFLQVAWTDLAVQTVLNVNTGYIREGRLFFNLKDHKISAVNITEMVRNLGTLLFSNGY